jgi:Ca2+-binding RTX toxin-like protein
VVPILNPEISMALPQISQLIGYPVTDPRDAFDEAAYGGDLLPPTTAQIVVASESGYQIIFNGSFTVAGGDVTAGTMTGYQVFAGATKVMQATGYAVDGAALFDALQNLQVNEDAFVDLLFGLPLKFKGSQQDDRLYGGEFGDVLLGRAGNDELFDWVGDNVLKGGKGDDLLVGGDGFNTLFGGAGADAFGFSLDATSPPVGFGRIKDFEPGEDMIVLHVFDLALPPGVLGKQYFHKGTAATTAEQVIIYDKPSGRLYFDVDGTGIGAQFQFAKLTPGTKLKANDFYVDTFSMAT